MTHVGGTPSVAANCATCGLVSSSATTSCPRCGAQLIAAATRSEPPIPTPEQSSGAGVPHPGRTVRRTDLGRLGGEEEVRVVAPTPLAPAGHHPASTPTPGSEGTPATASLAAPVDLGRRFGAHVIDGALLGVVLTALYVVMVFVGILAQLSGSSALATLTSVAMTIGFLALLTASVLYYVRSTAVLGQTIGKRLLGLRVVDIDSGEPIGLRRSLLRYLYLVLMGMPCYLGYLTLFTDSSGWNRGWHDRQVRDVVVSVPPVPFGQAVRDVWSAVRASG